MAPTETSPIDAVEAIYLDNASTTAVSPAAVDAMLPILTEGYGNPSGAHRLARAANKILDEAREEMAHLLGADPSQLIFTSGGTEADNLAVKGVLGRQGSEMPEGAALCSAIEHHAVYDPVLAAGGVTIAVGENGQLDLDDLKNKLTQDTALVSVMLVNNETGIIQPLAEVIETVRTHSPNAVIHSDAVQAFCWLDVAEQCAEVDLVSFSGHKFGGPKGIGVLVSRCTDLVPLMLGGSQERGRRGGTQNVAGVAAMVAAARETAAARTVAVPKVRALRDCLSDGIFDRVSGVIETGVGKEPGDRSHKVANICHMCFEGVESEALLFLLEKENIMASAAASCSSGAAEPSHVLAAMGYSRSLAFGSLRLSLGYKTSAEDVDAVLAALPAAVERIRERS